MDPKPVPSRALGITIAERGSPGQIGRTGRLTERPCISFSGSDGAPMPFSGRSALDSTVSGGGRSIRHPRGFSTFFTEAPVCKGARSWSAAGGRFGNRIGGKSTGNIWMMSRRQPWQGDFGVQFPEEYTRWSPDSMGRVPTLFFKIRDKTVAGWQRPEFTQQHQQGGIRLVRATDRSKSCATMVLHAVLNPMDRRHFWVRGARVFIAILIYPGRHHRRSLYLLYTGLLDEDFDRLDRSGHFLWYPSSSPMRALLEVVAATPWTAICWLCRS